MRGHRFDSHLGIRDDVECNLVEYQTVTRSRSIDTPADARTRVRVDFTGGFGHEVGLLDLTVDAGRCITRIGADLQ